MEVTRKNFRETLPLVSDSIEKADFLVIDAEFTGLTHGREVSMFDTPEEYYNTLLNGSSDFLLIQFGLCAFYWDDNAKQYMNDAYNFYLFPRGRLGDRMFLCQTSSLDFLAAQGFDFNKLIKEGISFMSEPVETRLRENLAERQKNAIMETHITIPEENKKQINEVCARVRSFLDEKKTNELEIDRCNAFVRRLLYQELGTKFKNEAFVETKILENKNRVLIVKRICTEHDGKNLAVLKKEREWEELEDAVGFSKVARMISQSEKLVVGHNMLLDLIHTLNHFFQPLPPDYASFKEFAHCMFPKLLDTKYMSSLPPFKDKVNSSVLSHLLVTLSEPPFALPVAGSSEGRGYSQADDKLHEAGFDAYVTGLCFLAMHGHLSRMRGEPLGRAVPDSVALKPFLNKVFLARTAHQDSPYINLTGADPNPSRDHVFHLTFPKEWTRNDINQLFSPFCAVTVNFVNDTSALVALSRRELARGVLRALANNARVALQPYHRYKHSKISHKEQEAPRKDTKSDFTLIYARGGESPPKPYQVNAGGGTPKQKLPEKLNPQQVLPEKVERVVFEKDSKSPEKTPEKPKVVEKGERQRSHSVSAPTTPQQAPTRKRTSSGVFQVDETEPLPKKVELVRTNSDGSRKRPEALPNGRRKTSESDAEANLIKEKLVTDKFDAAAKSNCVNAFKESDSWD